MSLGDGTTKPRMTRRRPSPASPTPRRSSRAGITCARYAESAGRLLGRQQRSSARHRSDDIERTPFSFRGEAPRRSPSDIANHCAIDSSMKALCWGRRHEDQYLTASTRARSPGWARSPKNAQIRPRLRARSAGGATLLGSRAISARAARFVKNETAAHHQRRHGRNDALLGESIRACGEETVRRSAGARIARTARRRDETPEPELRSP